MKKVRVFIFIIISFFIFSLNVYADDDTSCNYKSQNALNKIAYAVEFNYNIKNGNDGKPYFEISVYNITDDIVITVTNDVNDQSIVINDSMTTDRTYTFYDYDILTIKNYTFAITPLKYGCVKELRKYKMKKPRYNDISELPVCREESMLNYNYCKEWVNSYFKETREEIIEKINKKHDKNTIPTTTECASCKYKEELNKKIEKTNRIKLAIIIGLIIGIIIDIAFIIYLLMIIKQNNL